MNKEIENKVISSFIIKRKKERAKHELWNDKKRQGFIWVIDNHEYIDDRFSKKVTQSVSSYIEIYELLRKQGVPDECYVIALDKSIDGKTMPLKDALKVAIFNGPAKISCVHGKLAYFEGEEDIKRNRLLLIKDYD